MNCTFLDFEPFCRAALSSDRNIEGIGLLRADRIRNTFEKMFPQIDRAILNVQPQLGRLNLERRVKLALYGFISVAGADDLTDGEIEQIAQSVMVSRQYMAA